MTSIAEIFAPLIPAIIVGGLILGFRNVIDSMYVFGDGTQPLVSFVLTLVVGKARGIDKEAELAGIEEAREAAEAAGMTVENDFAAAETVVEDTMTVKTLSLPVAGKVIYRRGW